MIPEEKSAAVTRGLREAFGVTEIEDIQRITRGRSPGILVFRIVVQGRPLLLRIITRTDSIGPARHFTCMQAAAEAGLAPRVRYTSIEDQVSITDFVEQRPFPVKDALVLMPRALRTLHALAPFPRVEDHLNTTCLFLMNPGPALDGFLQKFAAANVLSQDETGELLNWRAQLASIHRHDHLDLVSSHNDLFKPDNILFDGHRVWLVDWEAAFLNDRYADLAVVANLVVTNVAEERVFLEEYFGQAPDEYQLARFFLMQQAAHLFYALVFLFLGSMGKPAGPAREAPGYRDFQQRFWAGGIDLAESEAKVVYGRVHLERLRQNMGHPWFKEALRIVSDRRRSSC